ncbi:recombinase family protein [Burkholderia sp. Bp9142]|uniref:recombinase family protein n=1 Tax=Burkholderia sp. Bp9142 TaxID=2184573 RepID=UPI0021AB6FE9|nr:recombinase family protein [Burkholderia sp. Bp9142]
MKIDYARASTSDHNFDLQREALARAGCTVIYEEQGGGHRAARPKFEHCLNTLCEGDTLTVWRLDCLGRSLSDLIRVVSMLNGRGVAFESINDEIETSTAAGKQILPVFAALAKFERDLIVSALARGWRQPARAAGKAGEGPSWMPSRSTKSEPCCRIQMCA